MAEIDQYHELYSPVQATISVGNETVEFAAVDMAVDAVDGGVANSLTYLGNIGWTDGTLDISLEESDDNSVWTPVSGELVLPENGYSGIAESTHWRVGYVGKKRYVRVVLTGAGTGTAIVVSACAVLGNTEHSPVAAQPLVA